MTPPIPKKMVAPLGIFLVENGTHVLEFLVKKRPIRVARPCMS